MDWYILRHAEKEPGDFFNPALRHQDQPISAKGRADSKTLLPFLAGKAIDKIYVSEYRRTWETIRFVADNLHLSPIIDPRLNEIDNGIIEGLTRKDIQLKFPETWQRFQDRDRDFRFPEGESGAEAQRRINSLFKEKITDQENILLVTHDGLIRLMLCTLLGLPVYRRWDFQVDTCGMMEIKYLQKYEQWQIIRFNQICHAVVSEK